jgi:putative FmdB family regulatory protein
MPVYEYRCNACRRRFSVLVGVVASSGDLACKRCGAADVTRLISRFARIRSEDDVLDSLADNADMSDIDENDPASVARWMKRMGSELGDEMGDDFEAALEEETDAPPFSQDDDL